MAQLEDLLNGLYAGKSYLLTRKQMATLNKLGGWYMHAEQRVTIHSYKWGENSIKVWGKVEPKHVNIGTYREPVWVEA